MKLFYHHVGEEGSSDFDKTVIVKVDNSLINKSLNTRLVNRDEIISGIHNEFPEGSFNCWGVPAGASARNRWPELSYVV